MNEALPLGVFGGTFDPVHVGHLRLAEEAREALQLGRVRWIPAGQPWHRAAPQTSPAHRLAMVEAAVASNEAFEVDGIELSEGRWFTRDEAMAILDGKGDGTAWFPPPFAIAHQLIKAFAEGKA